MAKPNDPITRTYTKGTLTVEKHLSRVDHSPVTTKARTLSPFNGYHGQLFYAAACLRTAQSAAPSVRKAMLLQAEAHLCNALGCANVQGAKYALGNIMTALNGTRSQLNRMKG